MTYGKHFQSNRKTRIYMDALIEVIGAHGLAALLRLAGLSAWVTTPPPYDDAFGVDYADFAKLNATLEDMYGPRGGRALALRAGRASFRQAQEQVGKGLGMEEATFKALPLATRIRSLLQILAKGNELQSGSQVTIQEEAESFTFSIVPCPACWGRSGLERSVCHGTTGLLIEAINWIGGGDGYRVEEVACAGTQAAGAEIPCVFAITKT